MLSWPDAVDEVVTGDQALAVAYVTPARGVVLLPLTNTGVRDRAAGRLTPVTSSVGMWRKLARIQAEPRIALAFHTRAHGFSDRPEYVLVQGRATLSPPRDRSWVELHSESWERFSGPRAGGLWKPLLRAYYWRVAIEVEVERVVMWPDLACAGVPEVHGSPLPGPPAPQDPPGKGTGPRVDHARAARRAAALPNVLLGWVGGDGYPVVVPVDVDGSDDRGIGLSPPAGADVPAGGRRSGLLAHSFARYTYGQNQRHHTGWLEAGPGGLVYAPHTAAGYRLPASRMLFHAGAAVVTTRGLRSARRAGFV